MEEQAEYRIAKSDVGTMNLDDLTDRTGLVLRPKRELALQEASYVLDTLYGAYEKSQFWIGDLLNYCKETMGESYAQIVDETRYSISTLQNFMWVAERVRPNGRWDTLTFDHHSSVAKMEPPLQDEWLERAASQGWSAHRLRQEIKGPKKEKPTKIFHVPCPHCGAEFDIEEQQLKDLC